MGVRVRVRGRVRVRVRVRVTLTLTLFLTACVASVQIESVDGIAPMFPSAEGGVSSQETVNFGETPLNTVAEQVVRLLNTTPLPLRFEWRHRP